MVEMSHAQPTKRRCPAMVAAGVDDPESPRGKKFCAGDREHESQCPYRVCIVFELGRLSQVMRTDEKADLAKRFLTAGVSVKDIALIMAASDRTIRRYLKR